MSRLFVVVVVGLAACSDDPLPTGPITARITHYDYEIDMETRSAHAELTMTVEEEGDCVTLPMRAQLQNTPTINDDAVNATVEGETVRFCGVGYREGAKLVVAADMIVPLATLGASQVGFSITKDSAQNSFYYLVSWVGGCDRFGPCDNRPDQFATYTFTVRHPAGFKARCPGTVTEVSDTETTCAFDHAGGPTYSTFGIAAYPAWTVTDKGTWGGVKVTLYDRPTTLINDRINVAYHSGFIDWMQSQFGPYPYGDELRVLTAPTFWSGFEHPGNIVLDDGLARRSRPSYWNDTAHVLDHEIVHMWAGDQTTIASTYDFVWKEAMAEYLTFVWESMQDPATGRSTSGAWKGFSQASEFYPVPLEQPALFDYYGDVYGPGPMTFFRQLEVLTSRAQVLAAIQSVLGTQRALSVDELLAALETSTGMDLDAYAAAWVRGTGVPPYPKYNMTFTPGTGTSTLVLDQITANTPAGMGCKFHVSLNGAATTERQLVEVNTLTGGLDQTLQVPTPAFTVTSLTLDPDNECLVFLGTSTPRLVKKHPWLASDHR